MTLSYGMLFVATHIAPEDEADFNPADVQLYPLSWQLTKQEMTHGEY